MPSAENGQGGKNTLFLIECEVVLCHHTAHSVEALVAAPNSGPMDHNVNKINGNTWDPSKDGGYYLLKTSGVGAQAMRLQQKKSLTNAVRLWLLVCSST